MLRITRTIENGSVLLKLEGKLLADWVPEVLEQIPSGSGLHSQLNLDLAQVSFIDAAGEALLRGLISRGANVSGCSSYLSELLNVEKK
jgi:ABC-type transporter Mla MlaB component